MTVSKSNRPLSNTALERLYDFLEDAEEDVKTLPLETILKDLKRQGVETESLVEKVRQRLADMRAEDNLAAARLRRIELVERISAGLGVVSGNLQETLQRLSGEPGLASAYARNLESVSAEDRQSLLEDIAFLEAIASDEKGARS